MEQGNDTDVMDDFTVQQGKPNTISVFRDWLASQMTIVVAAGIMTGDKYMRPLHSMMQWTSRRADDEHNGLFFAAVGGKVDGQDSPWVEVLPDAFGWVKICLPTNTATTSAIWLYFNNPANRLTLFDAAQETKCAGTWVPRYPMLPMEVVLKVTTNALTPWELWRELHQFVAGRPRLKAPMKHAVDYALAAAIQSTPTTTTRSKVTLTGKQLTVPSDRLRKVLQQKLTGTLRGKQVDAPITQVPAQNVMFHQSLNQSLKLAHDAMNAMSARPADRANKYQQDVMHAMRSHTKNLSEPGHKRFTAIQKPALQVY